MHVNPMSVTPVKQFIANSKRDLEKLRTEMDDDAVGVTLSLRGGGSGSLAGATHLGIWLWLWLIK